MIKVRSFAGCLFGIRPRYGLGSAAAAALAALFLISSPSLASQRIDFSESISTCLTPAEIWREFSLAMSNSSQSRIWPDSESRVSGQGMFEAATIEVTYGTGFWAPTYSYILQNVRPGFEFTYMAKQDHPFRGGARVSLHSIEGTSLDRQNRYLRTRLDWIGSYEVPSNSNRARRFFERFSPRFFADLRARIRSMEQNSCLPKL